MRLYLYQWITNYGKFEIYAIDENKQTVHITITNSQVFCYLQDMDVKVYVPFKIVTRTLFRSGKPEKMRKCYFDNVSNYYITTKRWRSEGVKYHYDDPIRQFCCVHSLPRTGWVDLEGDEVKKRKTRCDIELETKIEKVKLVEYDVLPPLKLLTFDLEVFSQNPDRFPDANIPTDVIFLIGCTISYFGTNEYREVMFSIGQIDNEIAGCQQVFEFDTEYEMLLAFHKFLQEEKPQILSGYNIFGFDLDYMRVRSQFRNIVKEFQGEIYKLKGEYRVVEIDWESEAYSKNNFNNYIIQGVVIFDLYKFVQRDYQSVFNDFKLHTIANHFFNNPEFDNIDDKSEDELRELCRKYKLNGETIFEMKNALFVYRQTLNKDPIEPKELFKLYRIGQPVALGIAARYCAKDCTLVSRIIQEKGVQYQLLEMANICKNDIQALYTRGSTQRVEPSIYEYCSKQNIVMNRENIEKEEYNGGKVFDGKEGMHLNVCCFDYCSLYPSITIAYNVCLSTFVPNDQKIDEEKCHVLEWTDRKVKSIVIGKRCAKGTTCGAKYYDFDSIADCLDDGVYYCGVCRDKSEITRLTDPKLRVVKSKLYDIVEERTIVEPRRYRFLKEPIGIVPSILKNFLTLRKHAKEKMENTDGVIKNILNQRQLTYKIICNSIYGLYGSNVSPIAFYIGANAVTAMGQKFISKAAQIMKIRYNATVVYGDTDSVICSFPEYQTSESLPKLFDKCYQIDKELENQFPNPIKLEFEEPIYGKFFFDKKKHYNWQIANHDGTIDSKIGSKGGIGKKRKYCKFIKDVYNTMISLAFQGFDKNEIVYEMIQLINCAFRLQLPKDMFIVSSRFNDNYKNPESIPMMNFVWKLRERGLVVEAGQYVSYIYINSKNVFYDKKKGLKVFNYMELPHYFEVHSEYVRLNYVKYVYDMGKDMNNTLFRITGYHNLIKGENNSNCTITQRVKGRYLKVWRDQYNLRKTWKKCWDLLKVKNVVLKKD